MIEKPKNPPQDLTDNEKDILYRLGLKYITKFYSLQETYPNPKDYAESKLKSKLDSDSNLAFCHTLLFIKDLTSNVMFTPKELNKRLAEEIPLSLRTSSQTYGQIKFIHPRALREEVLKPLEKDQIISRRENREGPKENIKPGKKKSEVKIDNLGGRHSYYITNQEIETAKQIMKKPQAIDYLYDMVLKSGIDLKILKYHILTILHLMKMVNGKDATRLLNIGASNSQVKLTPTGIDDLMNVLPQLFQKLGDDMLEGLADRASNLLGHDKEYYKQFLTMTIFMKL